jgi:DNA primase
VPAETYVQALTGREPDRTGKIACPFHDDSTPSLQLYEDGTWYCYGACQAGGSIYDFAARLWHLDTKGRDFLQLRERLLARCCRSR